MRNKSQDMLWTIVAVPVETDEQALTAWDCASAACWGSEYKALKAVLSTLLYRLDFQLAEKEFARALPSS